MVLSKRRDLSARQVVEEVIGVEFVVAEELIEGAVELIRAGLGSQQYLSSSSPDSALSCFVSILNSWRDSIGG